MSVADLITALRHCNKEAEVFVALIEDLDNPRRVIEVQPLNNGTVELQVEDDGP